MGRPPDVQGTGENFVFCDQSAVHLSVKLSKDEAVAAVATETWVEPTGHGLGRHGWVALTLEDPVSDERWQQVEEWVTISYTMVAPKSLARLVLPGER